MLANGADIGSAWFNIHARLCSTVTLRRLEFDYFPCPICHCGTGADTQRNLAGMVGIPAGHLTVNCVCLGAIVGGSYPEVAWLSSCLPVGVRRKWWVVVGFMGRGGNDWLLWGLFCLALVIHSGIFFLIQLTTYFERHERDIYPTSATYRIAQNVEPAYAIISVIVSRKLTLIYRSLTRSAISPHKLWDWDPAHSFHLFDQFSE